MIDTHKLWALVAGLALCAQVILLQHQQIASLHQELRLANKAKDIESDQAADLAQQLIQLRTEKEISDVKQFVAGIVTAVNTPDHYTEVWHAGYDRGAEVQQYVNKLETKTHASAEPQSRETPQRKHE